jgi:hypothetical protein
MTTLYEMLGQAVRSEDPKVMLARIQDFERTFEQRYGRKHDRLRVIYAEERERNSRSRTAGRELRKKGSLELACRHGGLCRPEGTALMKGMSIHAGVHCAKCSRVHFPATLKGIAETTKVYQITCPPPCRAVTYFRVENMRTFSVPDTVYELGYAESGQYRYLF